MSHLRLLNSIVRSAERLSEVSFDVWSTEEKLVPCVCSMRFITE